MPGTACPPGAGLRALGACSVLALLLSACGGSPEATAAPGPVVVRELGLQFPSPEGVRDVVYAVGAGPEGQPAVFLSSTSLVSAGGPTCAAGATAAVSPYPLGRLVVSEESPEQIKAEGEEEDALGEPIGRLGGRHLYYTPPPPESCAPQAQQAVDLQRSQIPPVLQALRQASPAG